MSGSVVLLPDCDGRERFGWYGGSGGGRGGRDTRRRDDTECGNTDANCRIVGNLYVWIFVPRYFRGEQCGSRAAHGGLCIKARRSDGWRSDLLRRFLHGGVLHRVQQPKRKDVLVFATLGRDENRFRIFHPERSPTACPPLAGVEGPTRPLPVGADRSVPPLLAGSSVGMDRIWLYCFARILYRM